MKAIVKSITLILSFILFTLAFGFAQKAAKKQANRETKQWRYELEVVNTGTTGNYLVKVWSYSKKVDVAILQAKKNAVHGIIFKGFAGRSNVSGQPPLASNPSIEEEKMDYFDSFFADGGTYMKFVTTSTDGAIASEDIMKIGKEYKVGVIVTVYTSLLRKELESAGIIKSLSDGF